MVGSRPIDPGQANLRDSGHGIMDMIISIAVRFGKARNRAEPAGRCGIAPARTFIRSNRGGFL
jgi:hypothetical protein